MEVNRGVGQNGINPQEGRGVGLVRGTWRPGGWSNPCKGGFKSGRGMPGTKSIQGTPWPRKIDPNIAKMPCIRKTM